MTDRPIIFSSVMVRALIYGSKTMTRRVLKPQRGTPISDFVDVGPALGGIARRLECPVGKLAVPYAIGDRLWVREAWRVSQTYDAVKPSLLHPRQMTVLFEAGGCVGGVRAAPKDGSVRPASEYLHEPDYPKEQPAWAGRRRPSMFMPRWASRLTLTVTAVKVERLQEISAADAEAEGVRAFGDWFQVDKPNGFAAGGTSAVVAFALLWKALHGPDAWAANPYVAAISFTVEKRNIDPETPHD